MALAELTLGIGTDAAMEAMVVRELTQADCAALDSPRGITTAPLSRLRETHHQLARLLASGTKAVEVSAITGYSQSRISILQNDPAFQELIEHYRDVGDSAFADVFGIMASLSVDALSIIRERLHDQPEIFTNSQLLDVVTSLLDRTGHGATAKVQTQATHIHLSAEELQALKGVVRGAQKGNVISKLSATGTPQTTPTANPRAHFSEPAVPIPLGETPAAPEGLSRKGDDV